MNLGKGLDAGIESAMDIRVRRKVSSVMPRWSLIPREISTISRPSGTCVLWGRNEWSGVAKRSEKIATMASDSQRQLDEIFKIQIHQERVHIRYS